MSTDFRLLQRVRACDVFYEHVFSRTEHSDIYTWDLIQFFSYMLQHAYSRMEGQVSNPVQNASVKEFPVYSQPLLPATSKTTSGSSSPSVSSWRTELIRDLLIVLSFPLHTPLL